MKVNFALPLLFLGLTGLTTIVMAQSPGPSTATGNMTTPRFFHTATLLANGKVLITGGHGDNGLTFASAELFNPSTGAFTSTGAMTRARGGHSATLLANGKVLITGTGQRDYPENPPAELYDPSSGTFTPTGTMIAPRGDHSATLLRDGRVLIAGGAYGFGGGGFGAEIYDPSTGTFTAAIAGNNYCCNEFGSTNGTLLADGTVLVGTEVYNPSTRTFARSSIQLNYNYWPNYWHTTTLMLNGKAFNAGGVHESGDCFSQTELYDPATVTFSAAPRMTLCRYSHTATLLPSGTILIAGGASYDAGPYQANLASIEIYDFSTGTFGWIGNMIAGRQRHTATLLADGRVLIAGGVGAPGYSSLASAEIHTPPVLVAAPKLLSLSGEGQGQGAILHAGTSRLVSVSDPAVAGEILEIYSAGLIDGSVIPPQVAIGGRMAEVLFFGKAPGFASLNQVNVRVPGGVTPGTAVPVRLTYLSRPSNEVTIGMQ